MIVGVMRQLLKLGHNDTLSSIGRRGYQSTPQFTKELTVASATQILGLESDLAVSPKEIREAYVRELRKLYRTGRDNPTGLPYQAPALSKWQSISVMNSVPGIVAEPNDVRTLHLKKVVSAYRFLMKSSCSSRAHYAQFDAVTPDGLLGVFKMESPFSNHDSRHQTFQFTEPVTLPMDARSKAGPGSKWNKSKAGIRPGDPSTRGSNVEFRLSVTFNEAMLGCVKRIRYTRESACQVCSGSGDARQATRKCPQCKGRGNYELPSGTYLIRKDCAHCGASGRIPPPLCQGCFGSGTVVSEATAKVRVPSGCKTGSLINLSGQGNLGWRGGGSGALRVTVVVASHRLLHRVGDDLHVALPIALSTALLGGKLDVPTADGSKIQVAVPPGVSSGFTISVPGRGAPRAGSDSIFGDLRVHLIVLTPNVEHLSKAQREALLDFRATEEEVPLTAEVLAAAKSQFSQWFPRTLNRD